MKVKIIGIHIIIRAIELFFKYSCILELLHRGESVRRSFRNLKSHSDSACLFSLCQIFPL